MDDRVRLIERTDSALKDLEDAEIERLNAALDASYNQLEQDLLRKYPSYTAESQPGLLATQRSVLLVNELRQSLTLINPQREAEITARFERLLGTASKEGRTLGEELIALQQGDDFVKATATLPIEAVAFAARDAVKRLKKHDATFQEEASIIIQQGLIQGWGPVRTAEQLRSRLGVTKGRAEVIARTELISAQDSATRATYKNNQVEYYTRIGTQDRRICPTCAARAGQVYPIDVPVVLHPRDRCYSAPFLIDQDNENDDWIKEHASKVRDQVGEQNLDFGRSPFEAAAGLSIARPVWTPQQGYIDKNVERKGQNWATAALVLAVILAGQRRDSPEQPIDPDDPAQQDNELFKALLVGAALVGLSVGSYYLARARYRSGFKQSARMANAMIPDLDIEPLGDNDFVTFVAGGFAGMQGQSGLEYAPMFGELLPGHRMIGVPTPEFDVGPPVIENPLQSISANWSNVVGTAVVKGRNDSAVRMAAMAAAYYRKYGKPVNLIGYSGGGMVAAEAHEILMEMGIPTRSASLGTPWFGFTDLPKDKHISLIGDGDVFAKLPFQNRVEVKGVDSHWLDSYLQNPLTEAALQDWFGMRWADETADPRPERVRVEVVNDLDETLLDLYPQTALLSEAEIRQLPGRLQPKLLTARATAKALPAAQGVRGLLEGLQVRGLITGTEVKGLLEGLEIRGLLAAQEVKGLLEGFQPKGLLSGTQIKGLLEGLEIRGLLPEVNIRGLLAGFEVKGLLTGQEVRGLLEGLQIRGQLTGRLDPRQLPATAEDRSNRTLEALWQQFGKDADVEADLKQLLRLQLPDLTRLQPVALPITPQLEGQVRRYTAQQIYQQGRSVERGVSRLAGFRIRQRLAEIARQDLPMLPKLNAYRQAILNEIGPIASPLTPIRPPGTAQPEELQRFDLNGIQWITPELKATSPTLDLVRKLTELELPDEFLQAIDTIYITRQRNAAEDYWRKKLKLLGGRVPGTVNLPEGSITLYGGRGKIEDLMRQAGYLVAYRKFGALEAPEGSEYRRAMAEGRTITPYGFTSDAADFADSVAQFFLDPDRLKRFTPQRYNAIARLLNYRHPEKPIVLGGTGSDPRAAELMDGLRTRNREINQGIKAQREAAEAVATKQRSTKKVQAIVDKTNAGTVQASIEDGLSRSRLQEEAIDRLDQAVIDLEQRAAQILNPFNPPYFGDTPDRIRQTQRQVRTVERELQAIDKTAAVAGRVRANLNEVQTLLEDLTTRKESLRLSSQGQQLQDAWGQLVGDLDQAEQDLINLPRSPERAQALRDLVRFKAAVQAQSSNVAIDVAALHRQALQPKISELTQLAESLEALQERSTAQRNRLSDLQSRLSRLPLKVADLNDDQRARYNTVRSTKVAQSKLPQRVENYRTLKEAYTANLAQSAQTAQTLADNYQVQRQAGIGSVQAAVETRLQQINDAQTVLASLNPASIAWLVDRRNWEAGEVPSDLAIVLLNRPGRTQAERLQAASDEVLRLIGTIKGSANTLEQRITYIESISSTTLEQLQAERRRWEGIRDGLADEDTLTDRQIQAFLRGEKPVKAIDVIRYGNQLAGDLEEFNRNFVELLLNQEGVDPRTIIDQSELYRRAREAFIAETQATRSAIGAEIEQSLETLNALEQRISRDQSQQIMLEVGGRARSLAEIRAELAQANQFVDELLKLQQVEAEAENQGYLDPNRAQQRAEEARAAEALQAKLKPLRDELAEVNREIQKRREAAARGQKRGISTERLEAQQRRILRDIAKLGGGDANQPTN